MQHAQHVSIARADAVRDFEHVGAHVAPIVDGIDQHAADHALNRREARFGELGVEMFGQRFVAGERFLDARHVVEAFAGRGFRPILHRRGASFRQLVCAQIGSNVCNTDIERSFRRRHAAIKLELLRVAAVFGPLGFGRAFFAFEQRIALKLAFDEFLKLDVGKLQQLDRLLQLRRHHQGLALAHL